MMASRNNPFVARLLQTFRVRRIDTNLKDTFQAFLGVLQTLKDEFVDRDDVIDALACGLISQTNVLLIGEPGTAKSLIVRRFAELLGFTPESGFFEYLLTKFTEPSEIIGVLDLKKFQKDNLYEIKTHNKLPEANIIFLDEIFNANSAILNSLLMIINEKKLIIGDTYRDVDDILAVFGASNYPPEDPLLKAFFDRFPIRAFVKGIDYKKFPDLLVKELALELTRFTLTAHSLTMLESHLPETIFNELRKIKNEEYSKGQFITILNSILGQNSEEADLNRNLMLKYAEKTVYSEDSERPRISWDAQQTIKFIHDMNQFITNRTLEFINQERIYELSRKITTIKLSGKVFISDRSLKPLTKMVVAHAILTQGDLKTPEPTHENISFVLTKTWENEEQIHELQQICDSYIT